MLIGLVAGLATGALWGLTFIAPRAVRPFTEIDLAIGRYAVFGLLSLSLMAFPRLRPGSISTRRLALAVLLGGLGYVGYYVFVAYAVRLSGTVIPPLVIGALPVGLAIYGNWQDRSAAWTKLAIPLLLILAGLTTVNLSAVIAAGATGSGISTGSSGDVLLGTLCAFGAFAIWMVYGVINSRIMLSADAPDALFWTGLQGIGSFIAMLPLVPIGLATGATAIADHSLAGEEGMRLIAWSLVLGIAGSWIATWFWVVASRRLPLALSAQLIVSETLFALLYGFVYERRWPVASEWIGTSLLITGVLLGIRALKPRQGVAPVG